MIAEITFTEGTDVRINTTLNAFIFCLMSPPAVKIIYPVVDFKSPGKSCQEVSENTTIWEGSILYL